MNHTTTELELPAPISAERISLLKAKGIAPDIAAIDLEMVKLKLQEEDEGLSWSAEQCEDAEIEYKRYLTLCKVYPYPDYSIVPNKIMDSMWHFHILDTRAYCADSEKIFGGYFHHFPYFGMRGEEDAKNLEDAFKDTNKLYLKLFGESMRRCSQQNCWHDCKGRCWHACKSKAPEPVQQISA